MRPRKRRVTRDFDAEASEAAAKPKPPLRTRMERELTAALARKPEPYWTEERVLRDMTDRMGIYGEEADRIVQHLTEAHATQRAREAAARARQALEDNEPT